MTLSDGARLAFSFLSFPRGGRAPIGSVSASPVTGTGFVRTGGAGRWWGALLETSVPRVFAAGDVRSGSTKRCATAVGEGAAVVRLVHEHVNAATVSS